MNYVIRQSIRTHAHEARQRLIHAVRSRYRRGFGVHSPFVYHLVRHVITTHAVDYKLRRNARAYRRSLLHDTTILKINDFGTGRDGRTRSVRNIARNAAIDEKYGLMLSRIVAEYQPNNIVEFGTSLGMGTFYLAAARSKAFVHSIEGSAECAAVARKMLSHSNINNVEITIANFDDIAAVLLQRYKPELIYIDGNHTEDATLRYFNLCAEIAKPLTIIIFDDIHWSPGMTHAWRQISADSRVKTSIELARMGIVFFRSGCPKEYYRLRW